VDVEQDDGGDQQNDESGQQGRAVVVGRQPGCPEEKQQSGPENHWRHPGERQPLFAGLRVVREGCGGDGGRLRRGTGQSPAQQTDADPEEEPDAEIGEYR
jgi:hypothetical protein